MIVLIVLWYLVQQYLAWVLLSTYPAHLLSFLVKSHYLISFKHSSYSFVFDVSQRALFSQCPFLGFVDVSYRVLLVPPSKWNDEVVFPYCGYLTRNARAVTIIPSSRRMGCVKCFPPDELISLWKARMFSALWRVWLGMLKCSTKSLLIKKMFDPESRSTRIRIRLPAVSINAGPYRHSYCEGPGT